MKLAHSDSQGVQVQGVHTASSFMQYCMQYISPQLMSPQPTKTLRDSTYKSHDSTPTMQASRIYSVDGNVKIES